MEDLLKKINSFKEFIRWNDWAIDKLPVFFTACFYLILKQPVISHIFILDFFIFVVFISCTAVYGYLINNFADLDIDLKQGKKNSLSNFSRTSQILIILLTLAGVLVSGVYFQNKSYFIILWAIQLFTSTFYSLPPIRFKERGLTGLIIPFLAQLVVPTMICFSIFGNLYSLDTLIFVLYGFFKGGAYDIGHQYHDYFRDLKTKTSTFAVKHGSNLIFSIFKSFIILERIAFILLLIIISRNLSYLPFSFHVPILLPVFLVYFILFLTVVWKEIKEKVVSDPYYVNVRGLSNILHIIIPNVVFPVYLLFILILKDFTYFPLLVFFLIWIFPTPSKLRGQIQALIRSRE
jgi:4-hydroxybenzoate polyprenyltransferase